MEDNMHNALKYLTKPGIKRRDFLKTMGAVGALSVIGTTQAKAFSSNAKGRIAIIGGGAAGLCMAARLNRWLDNPDITLIDPSDRQYYQPGFTLIAAGVYEADEVYKSQESCIPKGVKWIKDSVVAVDPQKNSITTTKSGEIAYDFLVLTPGLQMNFNLVEGITRETLGQGNAHCIYDYVGAQRTWQAMPKFTQDGGVGIYTDTYTKHKCGGAPKKICLLTEDYARQHKTRDKIELNFFTASKQLYDIPFFTPRLLEIYKERNVSIALKHKLKGIDTSAKKVMFEQTVGDVVTPLTLDYDFLHFTPPMSAPDFVRDSGLGWTEGKLARESWVMVDKETLQHLTYPNIFSLGDCAGVPTSKTSAAIRMQAPIAAKNLIAVMEERQPTELYNGYAACPIITEYGKILMCEFDYKKEALPSMPFIDASREQWSAWLLKVYVLKPMYFYGMLNGIM